jgi:hypothetical protein
MGSEKLNKLSSDKFNNFTIDFKWFLTSNFDHFFAIILSDKLSSKFYAWTVDMIIYKNWVENY